MRGTSNLSALAIGFCLCACAPLPAHQDPWIARDKAQHFGLSVLLSAAVTQAALNDGASDCTAARRGAGVTLTVGIGKEVIDSQIRHRGWSWRDLVADAAGAMTGSLLVANCR